jgi:NAD(P)-dependent dehydrogenase (short-subunit alcohol dehydrogenase family)
MDLGIKGKVAIITGGGDGIGRDTAEVLSEEGVSVAICSRNLEKLERVAAEIEAKTGGKVLPVKIDTTDWESVQAAVKKTADTLGGIDILINCAAAPGGLVKNDIELADEEMLKFDLDTKLMGYFRMCKACVPYLREGGWGRIINIGGLTARCTEALSGMRNTAIVHMTKTLSDHLGDKGITVNAIHPGVTRTDHIIAMFQGIADDRGVPLEQIIDEEAHDPAALGRMLETREVTDFIVYVASKRASGITGESMAVDGGLSRAIYL